MKKILTILFSFLIFQVVAAQQLYINEFMASNDTTIADENGEYDDWIEIYNAGETAVNIAGMYITDDLSDPTAWQIPDTDAEKTTIPAGGYLILWADKDTDQGVLHVKIKLSGGGEQIGLFASDGTTPIDTLTFGEQTTDVSYGRCPDGGVDWQFYTAPTPGASNNCASAVGSKTELPFKFELQQNYPNPFNPSTVIEYSIPTGKAQQVTLTIYNLLGKKISTLVNQKQTAGNYKVTFNANNLSAGIYFYTLKTKEFSSTKKMILLK